eukprot:5231959-Alexandrium_andersonii.AAC.1
MAVAQPLRSAPRTWPWPSRLGPPKEHGRGPAAWVRPKNMAVAQPLGSAPRTWPWPVSYTHLRAHETSAHL